MGEIWNPLLGALRGFFFHEVAEDRSHTGRRTQRCPQETLVCVPQAHPSRPTPRFGIQQILVLPLLAWRSGCPRPLPGERGKAAAYFLESVNAGVLAPLSRACSVSISCCLPLLPLLHPWAQLLPFAPHL